MNKIILIVVFLEIIYSIQAQNTFDDNLERFYRRKAKEHKEELGNTLYEVSIKVLYDAPDFIENRHFGRHTDCNGNLYDIMSCLTHTPHRRMQVKGKIPEKYFHINITELPSTQLLAAFAARKRGKLDSIHQKMLELDMRLGDQHTAILQAKATNDTTSLTQTMLRDLKKTYHVKITDKQDTLDMWYLRIVDASKLLPYPSTWKGEACGADFKNDSWVCVGMELEQLCQAATKENQILVRDETNEDGLFNFKIPNQEFETMERLNLFLTQNYGLRFFKRRQLEPIKLIEFEE
jgi:hypothetical protein